MKIALTIINYTVPVLVLFKKGFNVKSALFDQSDAQTRPVPVRSVLSRIGPFIKRLSSSLLHDFVYSVSIRLGLPFE